MSWILRRDRQSRVILVQVGEGDNVEVVTLYIF